MSMIEAITEAKKVMEETKGSKPMNNTFTTVQSHPEGGNKEFATFNGGDHLLVDINDEMLNATISVQYRGHWLTFAFIGLDNGEAECCDVKVHHTGQRIVPKLDTRSFPVQKAIMFNGGAERTSCSGTLLTVLLGKHLA